jgi:Flp pilus assembly protein TadB
MCSSQQQTDFDERSVAQTVRRWLPSAAARVRDNQDFIDVPNASDCTMAVGYTQLLTEMLTRKRKKNLGLERGLRVKLGAFISHKSVGLQWPFTGIVLHLLLLLVVVVIVVAAAAAAVLFFFSLSLY